MITPKSHRNRIAPRKYNLLVAEFAEELPPATCRPNNVVNVRELKIMAALKPPSVVLWFGYPNAPGETAIQALAGLPPEPPSKVVFKCQEAGPGNFV
jgi:hypothetical protein